MSLTGKAEGKTLRGKINRLHELRGYSAYEVALVNGFEGTEEEWLASLKGEKGDKGDKGASGSTPSLSNYYTKNENDQKYLPKVLPEAQEPPVFLFGGDTGGYCQFPTSAVPQAGAVPYYNEKGVLQSATREGWYEDDVVTYRGLRYFNTYPLYLCRERVGGDEEESYVFYNDEGDYAGFDEISAQCCDSYKFCVIHDESLPASPYRQIVGIRFSEDLETIYFGNDEYKMTSDGVITKLK